MLLTSRNSIVFLFVFLSAFSIVFAQKPDFSLVGFGTGTVGGQGGVTVDVTTFDALATAVQGVDKKIIRVFGKITAPGGGAIVDVGSNKSIIGIGENAFISMVHLHLKNSQQIIIQNIKFSMVGSTLGSDADLISMETTSANEVKYVWIDHCEFFNIRPTLPETAAKKDLYDGMVDIKKSSSLITISWNYFHDHWKCSLVGFTATDIYDRKITYHHNYFKNIKSRVPSYRGGTGHIYNNFFEGLTGEDAPTSDAVNTREGACLNVESNYFKNYSSTIYCAIDDVVKEGFAYGSNNIFDQSSPQTAKICSSFTPQYKYMLDGPATVPAIVASWSGVGKLDLITNVNEHSAADNGISFNPYPVLDVVDVGFYLQSASPVEVTLRDHLGRAIIVESFNGLHQGDNTLKLNLAHISAGVYFCSVRYSNKVLSRKIVKE